MMRTTEITTTEGRELVTAAGRGDGSAFDELHRRHAALSWRLALAITGRPEDAATAVVEGTGTTFTALRSGRSQPATHALALATATRNAALDLRRGRDAIAAPVAADDADPFLAGAFGALPERWRSVLWLRDAEGLGADEVASVVELSPEAVDQLAVRARRGLRERYLKAHVATSGGRDCTRAIARFGALEDGTLNAADRANLERHLDGCGACAERRAGVAAIPTALSALATAPPADLHERSRAAWTSALATTSSTGLSPRTEKILAGASAFAAAVGVLGAALFGTGGGDDPVASPLAPLVADIDAPRPVDLSALTLPLTTPDPLTGAARRSLSPTSRSDAGADEIAAPAALPGEPTGGSPTAATPPAAEAPTSPAPAAGDLPIDVNLGEDNDVTVGPVTVDLDPDDGQDPLSIDGPEATDPVVDPVEDAANTVAGPVTEAIEPVAGGATVSATQGAEPVTSGTGQVLGGLGR